MRSGEEESYILLDDIRISSMEKGFEIHSVIFCLQADFQLFIYQHFIRLDLACIS